MSNRKKNRSILLRTLAKNFQAAYRRAQLAFETEDRRKWIIPARTWPVKHLYEVVYLDLSLPVHEQQQTFRHEGTSRGAVHDIFIGRAMDKLDEENVELELVSITLVETNNDQ
jgi:hypothetical protein